MKAHGEVERDETFIACHWNSTRSSISVHRCPGRFIATAFRRSIHNLIHAPGVLFNAWPHILPMAGSHIFLYPKPPQLSHHIPAHFHILGGSLGYPMTWTQSKRCRNIAKYWCGNHHCGRGVQTPPKASFGAHGVQNPQPPDHIGLQLQHSRMKELQGTTRHVRNGVLLPGVTPSPPYALSLTSIQFFEWRTIGLGSGMRSLFQGPGGNIK